WRRDTAATFPRSRSRLVPLGGPWIDEETVVETVDHQASGVAQHHGAGGSRKRGTAEPLVGRRRSLVARGRDGRVTYHHIDRMIPRERTVERDARAERLDRLPAPTR